MSNNIFKLSKIDTDDLSRLLRNVPSNLDDDDFCLYALEYCAEKGLGFNSHIYNIKKPINDPNVAWKNRSMQYFGNNINSVLGKENIDKILENWSIVLVPPSKCRTDLLYDNRLDKIIELAKLKGAVVDLLYIEVNRNAAHNGGRRDVGYYESLFRINEKELSKLKNKVIIFDDVITSGAQYKAVKNTLLSINPELEIRGLFLARTICN
ncbi:hypothetical protein [Myroides odoratimimus]|uniref:hypothetical protein n=1 Tax=Myroides odoratimimus TaxID=76832 RepID=UPI002578E7ED|nr:hypothetical protein [Myroides odoratimimus]MDM1065799.1 hypothetical protein [Myroides odoratimimus]MDM1464028.1 hypothetical protein [Myroides odoratimimus]MDM1473910.1 hypothetical protein [Myroides odoratimimus]